MSALRRRGGTPGPIRWLLASQLVLSLGVCAMFPFVPLYVRRHGGGAVVIALFVAGPLLANALVQVPAGRLVDRIGRRPVLIGALAGFAVLSAVLALDRGPLWLLAAVRTAEGVFGGAYNPAMRAAIADLSPPQRRAEFFGMEQSAFMLGLLLGPAFGGVIAAVQQNLVFVCAGVGAAGGCALIALRVPETRGLGHDAEAGAELAARGDTHSAPPAWWRVRGVLVAMAGLGAMGLVMSMYDVVWPLYMSSRGQGTVVIGLSVTLFAVPFLVLGRSGGRLADRRSRRAMLGINFTVAAATAMSYPFLHSLALIFIVGTVEAVSWVTTEPILNAVLADSTPAAVRGRAMAAGGLAEYAGSGLGALALGSLYGVAEAIPFWTGAVVLGLAGALCAALTPARPGLLAAQREAVETAGVEVGVAVAAK